MFNLKYFSIIPCGIAKSGLTFNQFLKQVVFPKRSKLETDSAQLRNVFDQLKRYQIFTAPISKKYQGKGLSTSEFHQLKKQIAASSCALTFLTTQNTTAARLIANCDNESVKNTRLPKMSLGEHFMGMALSPHLANFKNPTVTAKKMDNGYLIENATLRLCTGWGYFNELIIGFVSDGQEITAIIPFVDSAKENQGNLKFSEPLPTTIAYTANTVSLTINNWFIPNELVLTKQSMGSFYSKSLISTNLDSYVMGLIENMFDLMKQFNVSQEHIEHFHNLANQYENKILNKTSKTPVADIRAFGIKLFDEMMVFLRLFNSTNLDAKTSEYLDQLEQECNLYSVVTSYDDLLQATLQLHTNFPNWKTQENNDANNLRELNDILQASFALLEQAPWAKKYLATYQAKYEQLVNAEIPHNEKIMYAIKLYGELHALTRQIFRGRVIIKNDPISKEFEKNHQDFNNHLQKIASILNYQIFFNSNWPDMAWNENISNKKTNNLTLSI